MLKGNHWLHKAQSQIFGKTKGCSKPPKLRFRPGEYVRSKEDNQLYEIMWCFRFVDDPSVWVFTLEERRFVGDCPNPNFVRLCENLSNSDVPKNSDRILWQPIYRNTNFDANDYFHGDRVAVINKKMLNKFERVEK